MAQMMECLLVKMEEVWEFKNIASMVPILLQGDSLLQKQVHHATA
jgi:hypothetical protein